MLGYIAGGARAVIGAVQVAAAVKPPAVRPGQSLVALLLVQNAADTRVEVAATLHLPKSFSGQSVRFVASLAAGEVGVISLPLAAQPDAREGQHKLGIEVDARPLAKPERVREADGGSLFDPRSLPPERLRRLDALKAMTFSASKRLGRNIVETGVEVLSGGAAAAADGQAAAWISLWTAADIPDDRLLLVHFGNLLRARALPQLKRANTLPPLISATVARFDKAGYALRPVEALMIAKVMALILEYAAPAGFSHPVLEAGIYDLTPALSGSPTAGPLPRWGRTYLRLLARDERAAAQTPAVIARMAYEPLLRDAIDLSFNLVERATGEDVGAESEKADYADRLLVALGGGTGIDFARAYMPLVLGGIIVNEQTATAGTNFVEALRDLWALLDERRLEAGDNGQPVIEIAEQLIERMLQTYGFRRGST